MMQVATVLLSLRSGQNALFQAVEEELRVQLNHYEVYFPRGKVQVMILCGTM